PGEDIAGMHPSLVLLDLNLPGTSGYTICRSLKAQGIGPILVLTSRSQLNDELRALDLGADDYLTKPCHPSRLLARIEKLLHLYKNMRSMLDAGHFQLDENTFEVISGSQSLILPENEGKILREIISRSPEVVTKEALFQRVWGTSEFIDENILQVNITRLRKNLNKLGLADVIQTIRGEGYRLRQDGQDES
ncbi:MAG: response regulator transcription factor, partial [Anaerolineaceae bacterium]|nr:response regulator transcription factor [Anaerolineaceae bacterium]